jgi:hypothetical protein
MDQDATRIEGRAIFKLDNGNGSPRNCSDEFLPSLLYRILHRVWQGQNPIFQRSMQIAIAVNSFLGTQT